MICSNNSHASRIKAEHPMIKANRGHETCWQLYYPKSQTREVRIDNCRETSALTGSYREETALGRKHYRDNPNTNYTRTSMSCIGCRGKWNGHSEMSSLMYWTICLCSTQKSIKKKINLKISRWSCRRRASDSSNFPRRLFYYSAYMKVLLQKVSFWF